MGLHAALIRLEAPRGFAACEAADGAVVAGACGIGLVSVMSLRSRARVQRWVKRPRMQGGRGSVNPRAARSSQTAADGPGRLRPCPAWSGWVMD